MKRNTRTPRTRALRAARSGPALPLAKPLVGAGQIVQRLRAMQFAGCEEIPDAVLRTTAAKAEKTRESIRYNYMAWKRWLAAQPAPTSAFPADPAVIGRYLQHHSPPIRESRSGGFVVDADAFAASGQPPQSYATLQRFLSVLATLHPEAGLEDPTKHPEVVAVWRVLRRGLRKPQQKARLPLEVIWDAVDRLPITVEGFRNRAILLVAYALMARRSELVALSDGDLERHADGSITVHFKRTKTGAEAASHLPPPTAAVLEAWLQARPANGPAVFTRLDRGAKGERLASGSVIDIMRRALRQVGADIDVLAVGSHSARIGAAYDLALDGAADSAIMRDAGWKTSHMVAVYTRGARAREGALASLLQRRRETAES